MLIALLTGAIFNINSLFISDEAFVIEAISKLYIECERNGIKFFIVS